VSRRRNLIIRICIAIVSCTVAAQVIFLKHKNGDDWVGGLDYVLAYETIEAIDVDEQPLAQRKRERYTALRRKQGFLQNSFRSIR
jgi:hypothetical protein